METLLGLVAASTALGLAALGPILFLNANEPQPTAILPDDPGSFDALIESPQLLLKALGVSNLNTHKCSSPPSKACVRSLHSSVRHFGRQQKTPKFAFGHRIIRYRALPPQPATPPNARSDKFPSQNELCPDRPLTKAGATFSNGCNIEP